MEAAFGDLRVPLAQLANNEAQNARTVEGMRGQVSALQQQVAAVAQAQTQQQQEPAAPFAGIGKKMFPIEGLTSKVSKIYYVTQITRHTSCFEHPTRYSA